MRRLASTEPDSQFVFATCQAGAEAALKAEVVRHWPALRLAYSRPGFLTFKLPDKHTVPADFEPGLVFARTRGFSLGKVKASDPAERARKSWQLAAGLPCEALHVWQRDAATPGYRGSEPNTSTSAREAESALRGARPSAADEKALPRIARTGQMVLDCVLVESGEWWIGFHRACGAETCWPGGSPELALPADAVSRAYLKMQESLAWSALPARSGQIFAEIGCSPGGASQALLARGLSVVGIDPAQVDERVFEHPRFKHIRKRGADVRRRDFRTVDWLAADMNVAPDTTLEIVEGIVTHPSVNIRGLLLTLKLLNWSMAERIDEYLARIRGWGYGHVRARQLAHNRQEICVVARRRAARRREPAGTRRG